MKISEALETLKDELELLLPDMLDEEGLDDFAIYHIGTSREPKEKGLFIYQNQAKYSYIEETLSFIIQLQLFSVNELESAKYTDVVKEFFKKFNSSKIGYTELDEIDIDAYYDVDSRVSFVFLIPTWKEMLDDCDYRN